MTEIKNSRNYEKFFTPPGIAQLLCALIKVEDGQVVLEPSAGNGSLVKAMKSLVPKCKVFAIEINEVYRQGLKDAGADVAAINNFLNIPIHARFNACVANPPFGNENNIQDHFDHICRHVKKRGPIAMIVPADFCPYIQFTQHPIENWSQNSDGSTTKIKIIHFLNP